ncbi:hypothetical protein OGAPHI_001108 [Ogataea philodendri]|uniref:Uncharacterized protein n=1 Tax=Ogataea philodendri TaxID=1378263 RepID=A0A9P8T8S2_9ASCO|nr:uncharacterized protein OGAPHI_001108 [Ogataea philodendri]KAH3670593.1 hypothetical protein OGAPHI_001108 [Ogataea philodendri]
MPNSFRNKATSVWMPLLSEITNTSPPSWTNWSSVSVGTRSLDVVGSTRMFWYRLNPLVNKSGDGESGPTRPSSRSKFLLSSVWKSLEYCVVNSGSRESYSTSVLLSANADETANANGVRRNKRKNMNKKKRVRVAGYNWTNACQHLEKMLDEIESRMEELEKSGNNTTETVEEPVSNANEVPQPQENEKQPAAE